MSYSAVHGDWITLDLDMEWWRRRSLRSSASGLLMVVGQEFRYSTQASGGSTLQHQLSQNAGQWVEYFSTEYHQL